MKNKRGLSDVVSTTLIILITVAAAGLLMSFIMPFVQKSLSTSSECLAYSGTFTFESSFGYNCYDSKNLHGVSVRGNSAEAGTAMPTTFSLVFYKGVEKRRVDIVNGTNPSALENGTKLIDYPQLKLATPKAGEVRTYIYNATQRYDSVEIYPIAKSGKICDKSDEVKLQLCNGATLG